MAAEGGGAGALHRAAVHPEDPSPHRTGPPERRERPARFAGPAAAPHAPSDLLVLRDGRAPSDGGGGQMGPWISPTASQFESPAS